MSQLRISLLTIGLAALACFGANEVRADSKSAEVALLRADYKAARKIFGHVARQARAGRFAAFHQFNVARVSLAEGDARQAKKDCARIRSQDLFWYHLCNARSLALNRRTAPAEEEMTSAISALGSREYGMEHLHVALATLKLAALRGQNREAVAFANEQFTAIAQTDLPNDASVPFVLAALRIEQARSESTSVAKEKAYRAALALVPAHPDALYELGRLQADTALLRKASGARTKWLPPRRTLADVLLSRGDMTAALQAAREALQNEPNDPASLRIFALASESLGEKAAWERLGHALHAMPNDGELLMAEARLLHRKGEHEAALEKLERVAALQMANPTPYIECAKIALATSRPRLAGGYLDQALSRDPKNTTALGLCKKTNCQKLK